MAILRPYPWAERVVRMPIHLVPEAIGAFLVNDTYAGTFDLLSYLSREGLRSDFRWLVRSRVVDQETVDMYRILQAVNYR